VLLTGVTGATIGHEGGGGSGNTIDGDFFQTGSEAAGMVVGGPGSACESTPPCNPGDPGYGSTDNSIIDNTLSDNAAGIIVEGAYAPNLFGGSSPYAAFGNTFGGNQISESELNAADFSGFYNTGGMGQPPSQVILNQWGPNDPNMGEPVPDNSCDPVPGGNGLTGPNIYAC
jgi:parallel beta-helix repeat protein